MHEAWIQILLHVEAEMSGGGSGVGVRALHKVQVAAVIPCSDKAKVSVCV